MLCTGNVVIFLHDGEGRGTLGEAANATFEICLELLLADIAQSAAGNQV
jgi:hypothetical protein